MFAHADVVPPGDNWLFTSPFEPIEKDGFLIGRGVYDNKAGIMMALYAAKAIDLLNIPFHSRLLIFTGSNEESGMKDIQAFAENENMPDIYPVRKVLYEHTRNSDKSNLFLYYL